MNAKRRARTLATKSVQPSDAPPTASAPEDGERRIAGLRREAVEQIERDRHVADGRAELRSEVARNIFTRLRFAISSFIR